MNNEKRNTITEKLLRAAPAVALLGATACGAEAGSVTRDNAEPHPDVTSITIKDGATVREEPVVTDPAQGSKYNVTGVLKDTVVVDTPDGAVIATDQSNEANGKWYQVPANTMKKAFKAEGNEDAAKAVEDDEDGQVWVNEVNITEAKE